MDTHPKLVVILYLLLTPLTAFSQSICFNYKGVWSPWERISTETSRYDDGSGVVFTTGGLTYFSFQISNFIPPSRERLKEHRKSGEWLEYSGYVEYYVNDQLPTAGDIAKECRLVRPNPRTDVTPTVKRQTYATIKIAPYKDMPEVYNLRFDDIAIGISIQGLRFDSSSKKKSSRKKKRIVANVFQSILLFPIGLGSWAWNPING